MILYEGKLKNNDDDDADDDADIYVSYFNWTSYIFFFCFVSFIHHLPAA